MGTRLAGVLLALALSPCAMMVRATEPEIAAGIRVKYVSGDAVYLEAGSSAGISEGQSLVVWRRDGAGEAARVAEILIESVALKSSAGRIVKSNSGVFPGDSAFLSQESMQSLRRRLISGNLQSYAQIVSFTEGAPNEQEIRESLPKPPLPEVNRVRGRIGVDSSIMQVSGSDSRSAQFGFVLRLDARRIGGTHWNVSGSHRGRFQSRTNSRNETLSDLINRTYNLSVTYDNPQSHWVLGAGRLYVPWASSLNTMDGFYFGRRIGGQTIGLFAGTNPDPTSWNYDSRRRTGGVFVNFERGDFESFRVSSTSGVALSRINWRPDRQFGFFENAVFYKKYLSMYSTVEADLLTASQNEGERAAVLSRSYLTIRFQPHDIISFDVSENYFRNIPTFDTRLIGTGLLDRFLFQGLSGGFRLSLPRRIGLYANTGRSSRTGDHKPSWNYLAGLSVGDLFGSGIHADYRFSRFDGSFGKGDYHSLTAVRDIGERLRFEMQMGRQGLDSPYTPQTGSYFVNGNVDWFIGYQYFVGVGVTTYRGETQNYNQFFFNVGYRFDNRRSR